MSNGISLEDLKGMNIPGETITNPNLNKQQSNTASKSGKKMVIDPAKEFGIPSQRELDKQDPDKQFLEDKVNSQLDAVIEQKKKEAIAMNDLVEQTEGNVTYEDYVEAHDGFDPLAMMENPPKLGISKEAREENAKREQEAAKRVKEAKDAAAMADAEVNYKAHETPVYQNDDIDPEAEEEAIIAGIPDEEESEILAEMEADENVDDIDSDSRNEEESEILNEKESDDTVGGSTEEDEEIEDRSKVLYNLPESLEDTLHRDEDADLKALDEDSQAATATDEISKKRLEALKKDAVSKIKPITSAFNLSQFTISSKPISMNAVTAASKENFNRAADWVLFHSKRPITMRSFRGSEIASLLKDPGRNRLASARELYGVILDHVVDPNKPEDVDTWLKTIKVADVDNLYAAIYRASFEGQNFLPYDCPDDKCANSFLSNSIPFMDMVKFKDDKTKEEFMRIYNYAPSKETSKKIDIDLVPISDTCVIGFKEPSIYDAVIMPAYLDDNFISRYEDMITLSTCVEQIFFIDRSTNELKPIAIKKYQNNPSKTLKAKIITISKIMKELNSDQYQLVKIYVEKLTGIEQNITFKVPETNCPKCGKKIEEAEYSAAQLVFIRHHLATLVNG